MPDFGRWTSNGGDPSLNEINRTDRFIEALSLERPVYSTDAGEAELAHLLAGWRDDARSVPTSGVVSTRDAVAALERGTSRHRPRLPLALVGSVAAAVLCLGGFGAAVYGSSPGDPLYGVRSSLFGEVQTTRGVQVELASTELQQVQQLIDQGQWQEAQQKLQTITTTVATVQDAQQKQELVDQWQQLSVKVESRDVNATVPPDAPPVVLPEVTLTTTPPTETSQVPGTTTPSTSESTSPGTTPTTGSTTAPTTTASPSESAEPGSSTIPTTTEAPTSTATTPPQTTSSARPPTTTAAPPVELPPPSATATVTTPSEVPVPGTATTTFPTVTVPTVSEPASAEVEAPPARGPGGGGQQQGPAAPVIELPLLPGLGGGGQR
ncbi:anti-sigma-D factor RsdA [Mycobacterium sp. 21AC1]|uniref:anti-sigma-D factor RsdA n=1 Tax=[Mycobacterium] appelbergii TaxID=2939269 RepID=UPI002938FB23|nr:anti-sigma-D factor RsdA [Mycobacterium sp. 21AC1]MDV3127400.1 anti-sigma-D factor RsdA [Mycobacterium sp. 21AC1]